MISETVAALLEGYPTIVSEPVRWGDMDAMGHVNNTVYFRYFEQARIPYMDALGFKASGEGVGDIAPILAATDCRFKMPLMYPDTVHLGCRIIELREDRMIFLCRVVSEAHQRVAAEGHAEVVVYDYKAAKKAAMPEWLRDSIIALQPELAG